MKRFIKTIFVFGLLIQLPGYSKLFGQSIPYLQKKGTTQELMVDEKPFLVLGGELGNSTASSLDYMQPFWSKFEAMHLNTILSPVYWELIEPEEGKFDFTLLDSIINASREHNLKLILALVWLMEEQHELLCAGMG